jgi:hypothetical protein
MVSDHIIIEVHEEVVDTIVAIFLEAVVTVQTTGVLFFLVYRIMNDAGSTRTTLGESVGLIPKARIIVLGCLQILQIVAVIPIPDAGEVAKSQVTSRGIKIRGIRIKIFTPTITMVMRVPLTLTQHGTVKETVEGGISQAVAL